MIVSHTDSYDSDSLITGIAGKKGFCTINIEKAMMNAETGFGRKVLEAIEQEGVSFEHLPSGIDTMSVVVATDVLEGRRDCGAQGKVCTCSKKQVENYLGKISRPVLDRIDIQVEVPSVKYEELSGKDKSESSKVIAERVQKARDIQLERFKGTDIRTNSQITPDLLHEVCVLDEQAGQFLKNAFEKSGLSARAYDRILKVARTCADLDGAQIIGKRHIARAVQYRTLDRKYWQ